MTRINFKIFTLSWWRALLILFFLWLLLVLWPIKGLLWPTSWWGQTLIVVMNDNEARPCGGFATAYGELRLPLVKLDINNSYALEADLGPAPEPLQEVTDRLRFWDLGTHTNLATCAEAFQTGYQANTDAEVDRVMLIQMQVLEKWAALVGMPDFFADTSRSVANVDRHDEGSLENRKNPAASQLKSIIGKTLVRPWRWHQITKSLKKSKKRGAFYTGPKSHKHKSQIPAIELSEWNLGGGKSSRYLHKDITLKLQERMPGQWSLLADLEVNHLGGWDEPLSQDWQGAFEINLPAFFEPQTNLIPAKIPAGGHWEAQLEFEASEPLSALMIKPSPGQNWHTNLLVQAFPQQDLNSKNLKTKEHIGTFSGKINGAGKVFAWSLGSDTLPPFMTLHTVVTPNVSEEIAVKYLIENPDRNYFYGEIHFNELVNLTENFAVTITDRDFTNTEISTDPNPTSYVLLPDKKTLILQFEIPEFQKDERFYIALAGVEDVFGNEIESVNRTLITR